MERTPGFFQHVDEKEGNIMAKNAPLVLTSLAGGFKSSGSLQNNRRQHQIV